MAAAVLSSLGNIIWVKDRITGVDRLEPGDYFRIVHIQTSVGAGETAVRCVPHPIRKHGGFNCLNARHNGVILCIRGGTLAALRACSELLLDAFDFRSEPPRGILVDVRIKVGVLRTR